MTRILSKITGIAILGLCLFMLNAGLQPATSHAACSNPAGVAADIVYNSSAKIFQYCDNTNWIRMNQVPGSGSGSCDLGTSGTVPEGTLFYNQDYRTLSGCAGSTNSAIGSTEERSGWKQISAGGVHSCGIKLDDTLYCWGSNADGRTGLNTSTGDSLVPEPVSGGGSWKQVVAGVNYSCGIKSDDTLYCWGSNSYGQLGDNSTTNRLIPTPVNGGGTWKHVSAKFSHTCGIKSDNTLHCWGLNENGGTGLNTTTGNTLVPTEIDGGGSWKLVSTGQNHSCGIKSDDTLYCWGWNIFGQVGNNSITDRLVPTAVFGGGTWKQVGTGGLITCGIKSNDSLHCWGSNSFGQVGDNSIIDRIVPTAVSGGGTWKHVAVGDTHNCGIKSDDSLNCWGSNSRGQVGDSTSGTDRLVPTAISNGGSWIKASAGTQLSCAIKSDKTLLCWGNNSNGQIGNNSSQKQLAPAPVSGGGMWKHVAAGAAFSCGIKSDDSLYCWGTNGSGRTGLNNIVGETFVPTQVSGGGTWKQVSAATAHSCAVKSDNTLHCWGSNTGGRTGQNLPSGNTIIPTEVSGGGSWKQVATANVHSCGIKSDNTLQCWGTNNAGRTGLNTAAGSTLVPTPVSGGGTWKQVAAGGSHTCGIKSDDTLHCWGLNSAGQLGDNSTTQRLVPTAVDGGATWKQVAAGGSHTCGIKSDDTLHCWGVNSNGQLGDNSTTQRLVPTAVDGGGTWKQVAAGGSYTCGIKSDDTLHCWGYNVNGQLGDNSTTDRLTPTLVSGGARWTHISTSSAHSCALIESDDSLNCWGSNSSGQLTATMYSSPYQVVSTQTACGSPAGKAGDVIYNADSNTLQYCDGVSWVGIGK